jgi:hypothetical protein
VDVEGVISCKHSQRRVNDSRCGQGSFKNRILRHFSVRFARAAVPAAHEISHEISQRVNGRERSTHTAHTRDAELNAELLSYLGGAS